MGLLDRLFGRKIERIQIASREPIGSFRVEDVFRVMGRHVLVGEVLGGVIYPGYKVKGEGVAEIYKIQMERREVEFAISGDRVALILEGSLKARKGDVLEVYRA
ncbi:tRNA-binding protein Pbp11 [Pyrococcus yayanosii]|uniref:Elongation factor Tu-type domain-containing protein n=1 Tax=Pyrococcus yayanosii (strain CH1 / JCM 16557) TaxID=529709 RepID=F8AH42_PYRYC|nr:tRNA-binding protein Pbp11 [Pyrococcus yayanosii]AEH24106.1 hypothetical protein PYCH_04160 [Pyrococcus yayanosii CH1]